MCGLELWCGTTRHCALSRVSPQSSFLMSSVFFPATMSVLKLILTWKQYFLILSSRITPKLVHNKTESFTWCRRAVFEWSKKSEGKCADNHEWRWRDSELQEEPGRGFLCVAELRRAFIGKTTADEGFLYLLHSLEGEKDFSRPNESEIPSFNEAEGAFNRKLLCFCCYFSETRFANGSQLKVARRVLLQKKGGEKCVPRATRIFDLEKEKRATFLASATPFLKVFPQIAFRTEGKGNHERSPKQISINCAENEKRKRKTREIRLQVVCPNDLDTIDASLT